MKSTRSNHFDLMNSLIGISHQEESPPIYPSGSQLQPASVGKPVNLDQLLLLQSIDDFVSEQLRPSLQDPSILWPAGFKETLIATRAILINLARAKPRSAKTLGKLALALDEERDLAELLQMYRFALLQT
jgi:hypothetical protein